MSSAVYGQFLTRFLNHVVLLDQNWYSLKQACTSFWTSSSGQFNLIQVVKNYPCTNKMTPCTCTYAGVLVSWLVVLSMRTHVTPCQHRKEIRYWTSMDTASGTYAMPMQSKCLGKWRKCIDHFYDAFPLLLVITFPLFLLPSSFLPPSFLTFPSPGPYHHIFSIMLPAPPPPPFHLCHLPPPHAPLR